MAECYGMNEIIDTDDTPPDGIPRRYFYMRVKAETYLKVGPTEFRRQFGTPPIEWNPDDLALVEAGIEQVIRWKGMTIDDPFTGIGISGFYAMMDVLGFDAGKQSLAAMKPDSIIDRISFRHDGTGQEIILFNEVPDGDCLGQDQ